MIQTLTTYPSLTTVSSVYCPNKIGFDSSTVIDSSLDRPHNTGSTYNWQATENVNSDFGGD